ncbi:MAG TPA: Nif3-like dinuclear metal center hexameric protein [Gemmataceae bacterium]|nr:Nif3-like dinuclear metal center hexameric protein [Gemmataceae bacterium]
MKLEDILGYLQQIAPLDLAADWDNVGLLLGDAGADTKRIITCLTVTPAVVAEAVDDKVNLIITHHPILFRATKKLTAATTEGRMLLDLARAGIAVYSAHTAFDNAAGGINDMIAERLQLTEVRPLRRRSVQQFKIVVFTPEGDLAKVSDAMFAAGAGGIGQYNECSFRIPGTGTFFGTESTNPAVGQKGRREEVAEIRLEVICTAECLDTVVAAMRRAHSYEEPAYDIYPLKPTPAAVGEGRFGRLAKPMPLGKLAKSVQKALAANSVQVVGDDKRLVQSIAIVCGAGGEMLRDAQSAKSDMFLTGEMRFHDCLAAEASGLSVLLPGHYATERFGMEEMAGRLQAQFPALKVWPSSREHDPVS